jgi:hypothetical protein
LRDGFLRGILDGVSNRGGGEKAGSCEDYRERHMLAGDIFIHSNLRRLLVQATYKGRRKRKIIAGTKRFRGWISKKFQPVD